MKISYKREMRSNYLIIEPEDEDCGYEHRMLLNNQIDGLLKFRMKQVDNNSFYYYEITSRQPLSRLLEGRTIQKKEIQNIILGIGNVLNQLERFLLKEEQILLEEDYIYLEPETFKPYFCLVPGWKGDFPKSLEKLLQYILKNVNHQDKESVVLAYSLYQESQKEWYGIENLMKWIYIEGEETIPGKWEETKEEEKQSEADHAWDREKGWLEDDEICEADRHWGGKGFDWKENDRKQKRLVITAGVYMAGSPAVLWLLQGKNGLHQFGSVLLMIDAVIVLILAAGLFALNKKSRRTGKTEIYPQKTWEDSSGEFQDNPEEMFKAVSQTEEANGTVLLASLEEKEGNHYLMSLDKEFPDICISYFPFVLGKQKNMVDYVMKKDTISRIHARLNKDSEGFLIKDLNSTNGTRVRGVLLEANEEVRICSGDEVFIAEYGFRFL